jgi:hypothetical protein
LGAGLTIQPRKKVIVTNPQRGGQGPNLAVEPYDDDDDDDDDDDACYMPRASHSFASSP